MDSVLAHKLKGYLLATEAMRKAMDQSTAAKDHLGSRYLSSRTFAEKYNRLVNQIKGLIEITVPIDLYRIEKIKSPFDTTGIEQKVLFDGVYTNLVLLTAFLEHAIGLKADEIQALSDFFQVNLRRAVFNEPQREKDIQDTVEQLLIGRGFAKGVDYDREVGRVRISIKEVVPDFIVPRLSLAIEVKLSKDKTKSKEIVDEINADIQAYGKKYSSVLFIVYDIGSIQDEAAFKVGLESDGASIRVVIVKH